MSVEQQTCRFEMPSTSGRNSSEFEVEGSPTGATLRLRYSWTNFAPEAVEPVAHCVQLPAVATNRGELSALLREIRRYALATGKEPATPERVEVDLSPAPGHSLRVALLPSDPGLITARWQAVFVVSLSNGPAFEFVGRYVVDATCLDIFDEQLSECLSIMQE